MKNNHFFWIDIGKNFRNFYLWEILGDLNWYPLEKISHSPLFSHGTESHGPISQLFPMNGDGQLHAHPAPVSSSTPPFMQVIKAHGSNSQTSPKYPLWG